ncbi:type II secretion system F family protein [Bdellovibrio svalbardensis]|uniref:Type II secretion system F family protein n=1 Tax=Bdellovibrio svalbardensis TaxID=2972972 RepID=A0ABT6DG38_9BACT|nr:type II secretion system F family protein [Bdellovibrio svalbardensis]MDG0814831.1 type II secretion system F family protein [Bdellovibrio svalbardensis]
MRFLFNEWIMIPLFGICVFVIILMWSEKAITWLHKRSLGQREEVVKTLRLMGNDVDEKKITIMILLMSFGVGALAFLLFWPNVLLGVVFGAALTIGGWQLPLLLVRFMYEKRCSVFTDQMVDGLTIMANGIKAGSNPQESMKRVVEIMGNPISQEFSQVLYQMQVGDSFESALSDLGNRIPRPDVQMFVTSINILKETGGNLAETFQTIVTVIRERQKVEKKIQALTAQGLMQGIIVTMIPFILMGVFLMVDPNFIKPMFTTTLGLVLLFVMLALQIIGGVVIKKLVTIKV